MNLTSKLRQLQARFGGVSLLLLVGVLLLIWLLNTPPGLLGKADAVSYAVCHRIEVRSFFIGERQFPLCIRCTGMYLGAVMGLIFLGIVNPKRAGIPPWYSLVVLGILFLAFAVDGTNSLMSLIPGLPTLYQPQHFLRLVTGTGMGLVLAVMASLAFNQTVWKEWDRRPLLGDWRSLAALLMLALPLIALVWTQNPWILYPLALISAAGVLLVLSMVYSVVVLIFVKRENLYLSLRQAWIPLLAGFGMALTQVMVFDLIRYLMTGTWDGFHFG